MLPERWLHQIWGGLGVDGLAWAHAAQEAQLHLEAVVCVLGGGGGGGWEETNHQGKPEGERAGEWTPKVAVQHPCLYPATSWLVIIAKLQPSPTSNQKRP